MKKTMIVFLYAFFGTVVFIAQTNINSGTRYSNRIPNLISSFNNDKDKLLHFLFADSLRLKWKGISRWILKGKNQGVSMRNLLFN
ncbi:MAG TPA: hypothetical protein VHZ50_07620 [Puia sp.]|jgi:hypothetical protein|nr:hypothetical protein [Puia sp.]